MVLRETLFTVLLMIQSTVSVVAHCEQCSRAYRVSDPERAYGCRACGGVVRVDAGQAEADHALNEMLVCNDCQTLNPRDAEDCSECGADLAGADVVEDAEEAEDLILEAKRAFRRASPWGRGIAWTFHFGAFAYALATFFAILALRDPEVPLGGGILVIVLTTLLSVLMGTAALHLLFQPYLWTLAIAVLATCVTLVHALGPNPFDLALIGSAAWALLSWILLGPARNLRKQIVRHKDLYILHHASQKTKRTLKGRSPGERHAQLMRAMRRADQRAWKISAVAAVVLVAASALGTYKVVTRGRPQLFADALANFESTWNGGNAQDIVPLFDPRVRSEHGDLFVALTSGYGWSDKLPQLPEGVEKKGLQMTQVEYDLGEFTLTASFSRNDLRWMLVQVDLPYPPIEPTLDRFRDAWHAADPKALAEFFGPENRAERLATLEKSKSRRGWDVFPRILNTELERESPGRATATMGLEDDEIVTKWYFRDDGAWGLYGLHMPAIRTKSGAGSD